MMQHQDIAAITGLQEPPLMEVMSDPIVQLLMNYDAVCEEDIAEMARRVTRREPA